MKKRQCCAEPCFTSACASIRIILNILKILPKSSQTNSCKTIKRRCQYHTNMLQSGNLQYIHWKRPSIRRLNFPNKSAYIPPKSPILADQLHIDQKRRPRHAQRYTHTWCIGVVWCSASINSVWRYSNNQSHEAGIFDANYLNYTTFSSLKCVLGLKVFFWHSCPISFFDFVLWDPFLPNKLSPNIRYFSHLSVFLLQMSKLQ